MEVHSRLIISELSLRKISPTILHVKTKCPVNTAEWTTVGRALFIFSIVVALSFWLSNQWVKTLFLKIFSEFYFSESLILKHFAGFNFANSGLWKCFTGIIFVETSQIRKNNSRKNVFEKKKETHKVVEIILLA